MALPSEADWYSIVCPAPLSTQAPGIYEWRIEGIGIYVGKARSLQNRIRAYPNNVSRLRRSLPWHGNPQAEYRSIHYALALGCKLDLPIWVVIRANCALHELPALEREMLAARRNEARMGGPLVLNG